MTMVVCTNGGDSALCRTVENGHNAGCLTWSDQISMELTLIAASLSTALVLSNAASILLAVSQLKRRTTIARPAGKSPPVSIIIPWARRRDVQRGDARPRLPLDYPAYELIFCVADPADPVVPWSAPIAALPRCRPA